MAHRIRTARGDHPFWSILKRGVVGTYHKVSRKYLLLYVAEFQFRYNNRGNADIFGAAVALMLRRKESRKERRKRTQSNS